MAFNPSVGTDARNSTFNEVLGDQVNNTYVTNTVPGAANSYDSSNVLTVPAAASAASAAHVRHITTTYHDQDTSESDSEVYARILFSKRHGYPLWFPEPFANLPTEYIAEGVSIGDVGIITAEGAFDFLFNICLPSDHPVNSGRVPPNFVPLELDLNRDIALLPDMHSPGCDVASSSVKIVNVESDVEIHGDR
jgi:hypothetical protein